MGPDWAASTSSTSTISQFAGGGYPVGWLVLLQFCLLMYWLISTCRLIRSLMSVLLLSRLFTGLLQIVGGAWLFVGIFNCFNQSTCWTLGCLCLPNLLEFLNIRRKATCKLFS